MQLQPFILRKVLAWSAHLFTATGVVWGFFSLRAIIVHEWKLAITCMAIVLIVDGVDGLLARWFDVKTYASGLNGALLDSIIDYFNIAIIPAIFLVEAHLLPDRFAIPCAIAILLTSAYQFTQVDVKSDGTQELFFKGFPSAWDMTVVLLLVLEFNPWLNLGIIIMLNILIFVPIKYVYPTRTTRHKKLTLTLSLLYGALALVGVALYPNEPKWVWWVTLTYFVYYVVISIWPRKSKAQFAKI